MILGIGKRSFTLSEVLIATAIFAGGMVFVLRSFIVLLSAANFSQNMTLACFLSEEKIWEIEQNYKRGINTESFGSQQIAQKDYKWNYTVTETDSLNQLDFEILWQERPREKEYSMKFAVYLPLPMKK